MEQNQHWKIFPLDSKPDASLIDIETDPEGYYLDSEGNRFSFNGNRTLKPAFIRMNLNEYQIGEIAKCAQDIHYFIFNYCKVLTKKGWATPELRDYQEEWLLNVTSYNKWILAAPRQVGKTISTALYFVWAMNFHPDVRIGIAANVEKGAIEVLDKVKKIFNALPIWMQQGVTKWNVKTFQLENNSTAITSATNGDAFRGFSFVGGGGWSTLMVDEAAFVKDWDAFADSVLPTVVSDPLSKVIVTSTPNGMNHYYEMVKKARNNIGEFRLQQVRWNCLHDRTEEWRAKIIATHGMQYYQQNYGNEFLGSSYTLLSGNTLEKLISATPLSSNNNLTVYQKPTKNSKYIVLGDLASGAGEDYTVLHVIKIHKKKYEQVAIFRSKTTPLLTMPMVILELAKVYNEAFVFLEINYGVEVANRLYYDLEYENLLTIAVKDGKQKLLGFKGKMQTGLHVSQTVKSQELASLKTLIESGKLQIVDHETITELYSFVQSGSSFAAEQGKHDDTVMALALLGWLVQQSTFSELTEFDYISDYEAESAELVQDIIPTSFFGNGLDDVDEW